ncbi:MAG: hypothetical protein ACKO5C_01980 [Ferruginibacter sp.]
MYPPNTSLTAICTCSSESSRLNDASRYLLQKKWCEWLSNQVVHSQDASEKNMNFRLLLDTDHAGGPNHTA